MNKIDLIMQAVSGQVARESQAAGQLTLGHFIDLLTLLPQEVECRFDVGGAPAYSHSYRGFYEQLAFDAHSATATVADVLKEARSAVGRIMEGYKGGEYRMGRGTWVWCAEYGCSGRRIVGLDMIEGVAIVNTAEDAL